MLLFRKLKPPNGLMLLICEEDTPAEGVYTDSGARGEMF